MTESAAPTLPQGTSGNGDRKPLSANAVQPSLMPLLSLDKITPFLTPATVAVTGILYLAGWTERHDTLRFFGLISNAFDEPIQATLARGFAPLLVSLVAVVIVLTVVFILHKLLVTYTAAYFVLPHGKEVTAFFKSFAIARWTFMLVTAFTTLSFGYLAGRESAIEKADHYIDIVETKNCWEGCYLFSNGHAHWLGIMLVQDSKRSVIYTKDGLVALPTDSIMAVVPLDNLASDLSKKSLFWNR